MNGDAIIRFYKQYPVAVTSFLLAAILLGVLYIRWSGLPDMEQRISSLQTEWNRVEVNVFKNSVNLEEHLASIKSVSEDAMNRFIDRAELGQNYRYFYGIENATGVRITGLEQLPPARPAPRRRGQEEEEDPLFSRVGYSMSITGTFPQLLSFLYALENGERLYRLNTLTCQRPAGTEEQIVTASITFDLMGNP